MTAPLVDLKRGTFQGKGYINLPLAILVKAKETHHPMWEEFTQSPIFRQGSSNCDSLSVACWVTEYWAKGKDA